METNYILMHRNIPVAELLLEDDGTVIAAGKIFSFEHLPVGTGGKKNHLNIAMFRRWFKGRSIPASRAGFQQTLNNLEHQYGIITSSSELVLRCYGLSLSDQYWVQPKNSGLNWNHINFYTNYFSDDIGKLLVGQQTSKRKIDLCSPNNTSDGWLPKKWVVINGERFLMKGSKKPYQQEPFNEVIASLLCTAMNINHVPYKIFKQDDNFYSLCPNMTTEQIELVPAYYISLTKQRQANVSFYDHFLTCCDTLKIPNARLSVNQMILLDYLMVNTDRHFGNFGALRNSETLEWIGIAPIFDTGTSLWNDRIESEIIPTMDYSSSCFENTHQKQLTLLHHWKDTINWDAIFNLRDVCLHTLYQAPFGKSQRPQQLTSALMKRTEMLWQHMHQQNHQIYLEP